jgi:NitT/TauT family transport system permease protein
MPVGGFFAAAVADTVGARVLPSKGGCLPLILFHTRRVREALVAPARLGTDLIFIALVASILGLILLVGQEFSGKYHQIVNIDLSVWALPRYTLLSLGRGFAAYALSLAFTLIYGTIAAHNRNAEKIMIPALDVLQSIPVLSFMPGLVLAMIALFPTRELGLELACVITIFTAQVWNMTFSFYGSIRGIPTPLREVTVVNRLGGWRVFRILELPASMIGLVWNSMMSMAGGWFILTVEEAFTLGNQDFRLPGIGSYMNEAINQGNRPAMFAAVLAMIIMIVVVDQCFWRPIIVWSERFKMEETADVDKAQSWLLDLLQHSHLWTWLVRRLHRQRSAIAEAQDWTRPRRPRIDLRPLVQPVAWAAVVALSLAGAWGAWRLLHLLLSVPIRDTVTHEDWLHVLLALLESFLRTSGAVVLSAIWTLPAGILIGLSPRWSQRLQPIVQVAASFPAPMLFPIVTTAMLELHIPFTAGCVALMLMGAQWYILFNVIAGAMAIPSELKEVGRVFRTPIWERWFRLYIPGVFPYLITGLITAAGGAWNATIVSEFVQMKDQTYVAFGLGSLISESSANGNYPLLAASTVTMAVSVVILNRLIWKRLYRLAENRFSLNM